MVKYLFIGIFSIFLFVSNVNAQEVWKITSLDWQPYSGQELKANGNSIQKLRQILKEENIQLKVEFYPWKRAQKLAEANDEFVGYFPAWPEEVQEGFVKSQAIDKSELGVLSNRDIDYKNLKHLFQNYEVGLINTYVYAPMIEKLASRYSENIDYSSTEKILLKKLSVDRIEVAITDPNVMLYLADKHKIDNIQLVHNIGERPLVLAISKKIDYENKLDILRHAIIKFKKAKSYGE